MSQVRRTVLTLWCQLGLKLETTHWRDLEDLRGGHLNVWVVLFASVWTFFVCLFVFLCPSSAGCEEASGPLLYVKILSSILFELNKLDGHLL